MLSCKTSDTCFMLELVPLEKGTEKKGKRSKLVVSEKFWLKLLRPIFKELS